MLPSPAPLFDSANYPTRPLSKPSPPVKSAYKLAPPISPLITLHRAADKDPFPHPNAATAMTRWRQATQFLNIALPAQSQSIILARTRLVPTGRLFRGADWRRGRRALRVRLYMMEPVLLCRSLEEWPKHRVGVVYIFGAGSIWYTSLLNYSS